MKLHQWFILSLLTAAVLGTSSLATVLTTEEREVNEALRQLKKISAQSASAWPELESFQEKLWRAMALDPSSQQIIPLHEVPKELFSEALTTDLNQQFETIKNSEIPKNSNAQAEFDEYQKTVKTILELRIPRQFPQARAIAKRGTLDETYNQLLKKIYRAYVARNNFSHEEAFRRLENSVSAMKQSFSSERMEKTSPFSNGNQFIWAALIAIIGFIFGITAIRMNPEFFEKFTNSTAKAATHTNQLNYARWLNEFESLLSKLKNSQLTHERRIEEVYKNSEKLNEFASALCADPRIKNEVNLEFRMSNLLRELHLQLEHAAELKTGDRAQIHLTLEHCLKLCDAIESGGIIYQKEESKNPPDYLSSFKAG